MLESLLSRTQKLSLWLTWIGGTLIVLSAFLVTLEILLRKIFNISLGGADEISGYAFGVATSFALSFALFERAHIRVDALMGVIPRKLHSVINLLGLVLLVGFALVVTTMVWGMVGDTLKHSSRSITPMRVPLAYPQIPWLLGWVLFVISGVLLGLVAVKRFFTGDTTGVQELIGVKSIDEQIQDESV
ncbi:TRAP transporter small permease subunit [Parasedimentitalea maritima]|uniref:TRAP transporter small permease protein n=1 Tax=Parasedimentitalea maritima TaxID=2578117 RepID=A0A6A4RD75_9RHOB|nr:TRAP transporter small permease [Zongyanglinia marina]KAE9628151.1 TRAP transporter small permease subunit [Zongyanglinia marina]